MEQPLSLRRSPSARNTSRLSVFHPHAMALCLWGAALGIPTAALCASPPSPVPLFVDTPSDVPPAIAQAFPSPDLAKQWVRQHRTMGLNSAALDAMKRIRKEAKPDITLDLFDTGTRTLELDEPETHRNKAKVWRGRLRGEQDSDVTLAVRGTKMVGTITSGQRLYKIEPAENNRHRLVEIDEDAMPTDHHPLVVPDDGTPAGPPAPDPELQQPEAATSSDNVTTAAATTNTIVDLMVVYTSTARAKQGGTAAMNALIAMAVDLANQSYANSRIAIQLRLVKAAEVAYNETGTLDTDLAHIRKTDDGSLDQIHRWRAQSKADVVTFIVDKFDYCGVAYIMANGPKLTFATHAFNVTARICMPSNIMAHEIGHNMGNGHDHFHSTKTVVYPYSFGYQDPGYFRTVMSYPCSTIKCPKIKYFSNPRILYNGRRVGVDYAVNPAGAADNARSMNEVRNIVAAWSTNLSTSADPLNDSGAPSQANAPADANDELDGEVDDETNTNRLDDPSMNSRGKLGGKSRPPSP